MNNRKLKKLFEAAGRETGPMPPQDFAQEVMRSLPPLRNSTPYSEPGLLEQLGALLPRVAAFTASVAILCAIAHFALAENADANLTNDLGRISEQLFLPTDAADIG